MIRVTLPTDLATAAGVPEVDLDVDDNGLVNAYHNGVRLRCFSWNDYGVLKDLYDKATIGKLQPDAQSLARVGPEPYKAKRRRKSRQREDNQLRAPEGKRYEDV